MKIRCQHLTFTCIYSLLFFSLALFVVLLLLLPFHLNSLYRRENERKKKKIVLSFFILWREIFKLNQHRNKYIYVASHLYFFFIRKKRKSLISLFQKCINKRKQTGKRQTLKLQTKILNFFFTFHFQNYCFHLHSTIGMIIPIPTIFSCYSYVCNLVFFDWCLRKFICIW
jgi:hypothetical protein